MKKRKSKVLAIVLALALAVTGIPVSSYAWSWGQSSQFNYVAVGDSIATGSGLSSPKKQAYPVLVGDLIEDWLGAKVSTDTIAEDKLLGEGYGFLLKSLKIQKNRKLLKNADLITISTSSNELLAELVDGVLAGVDKTRVTDKLVKLMTGETSLTAANVISAVSGLSLSEKKTLLESMTPTKIADTMSYGLITYGDDFDEVVRYVDEAANDDAVVAIVGFYNPLCIKAYAYYLAALIDGGSYLKSNQSVIDKLVEDAISRVKSMTLAGKLEAINDYLSNIDGFFSDSKTKEEKVTLLSRLILPLVIAFTDRSSVAAMKTVDKYFEDKAEELNKKGGRYYCYVPLSSVPSSGATSVLPSKLGHERIAEAIVDKVFSKVSFNVSGSGSAVLNQSDFSIEVTSAAKDGGYVVNGTKAKVTLTPGKYQSGGVLTNLLTGSNSGSNSTALYSVKVNGKTVSPTINEKTGVGTLELTFEEDTALAVVFAAGETSAVRTGYEKKYNKIVSLGDNTVSGLGLESFDDSITSILTMSNAKNSNKYCYPRVLAEYFDGSLISNLGNSALTTIGLYGALTGSNSNLDILSGINMDDTYYNIFVNYGEICDADLITIQVGFNELLFGIVSELSKIEGVTDAVSTELCQVVIKGGNLFEVIQAFVKTMRSKTDREAFSKVITEMVKILQESNLETIFEKSIVTVSEYLPKVVAAVHELNPNADVALIGYYNPYKISGIKNVNYRKYADILTNPTEAVTLFTDEAAVAEMFSELDYPAVALLLNSVCESAVAKANSYVEKCASSDPKAVYIDVTDIYKNPSLSIYPDRQGHIDIADRIVDGVINEVTIKTSGAAASTETKVVTTVANNKPDAEQVITAIKGNTSSTVAVRFGESLRIDLGSTGDDVVIKVDGKEASAASNFYLNGSKKDRTVEITYSGTSVDSKSYGLRYYYYPAYSEEAVNMDEMMNSIDLKAFAGVGYMLPEAPAELAKLAPTGKMFGGWCVGGNKTARQPGEVVADINADTAVYVNWIDDPDYDDGAVSYNVTVKGGVTADGGTAYKSGDRVYVYAADNEGVFNTWVSDNENLVIGDATSTCAYFFMPGENVTISATWKAKGEDEFVETMPYTDVAASDWFYDGTKYCYENKIMKGISDTLFAPNETTTRAMVVTMLYRMEGSPDVTSINSFADVKASDYYYNAVRWADEKGIVTGVSSNIFNPNGNVTREQIAAMLFRYAKYKEKDVSFTSLIYSFSDAAKVSEYAVDALGWANYNAIINGVTVDKLDPQGSATRAQVATMITRFSGAGR